MAPKWLVCFFLRQIFIAIKPPKPHPKWEFSTDQFRFRKTCIMLCPEISRRRLLFGIDSSAHKQACIVWTWFGVPFFFRVSSLLAFRNSSLGLWYLFNLTTSKWHLKCKTVQIFAFDFDWVKHYIGSFLSWLPLLCVSEISPPQKMMGSLGIGMKRGFITWSLSEPSELGSFHHIVKLCFVFRRCRMQPLSSRWETQLPWTSQRSDGCFPLGWWWLSGWMMLLFSPKNYDELEEPTPKSRRLRQVSGGCQRWSSADLEHMNPHGLLENDVDFSIRSLKPYSLGEV